MIRSSYFLASLLFASVTACAAMPADEAPSKADARNQAAKADNSFDFCEVFDWYGDGVCDDFCTNPDPDCGGEQYCYSNDDCSDGGVCNAAEICLSACQAGTICPAVCAGFCVEPEQDICGGFANLACDDDEFCSFGTPPSDAAADLSGLCLPRPQFCPEVYAPVCGRDGQTYGNTCDANSMGVDVDYDGQCVASGEMCGGFANIPCASDDEWCSFGEAPTGSSSDMSGSCQTRPAVCPAVYAQVCGRDGNTYNNPCQANQAGVDAVSDGPCS